MQTKPKDAHAGEKKGAFRASLDAGVSVKNKARGGGSGRVSQY